MKIRVKTKTMNQERKRDTLNPGREAQNDHIDYARDFNQREIKPSKKIHTHTHTHNQSTLKGRDFLCFLTSEMEASLCIMAEG